MTSMRARLVGLLLALGLAIPATGTVVGPRGHHVRSSSSISIDGWRWDYLERFTPPTLGRLASTGVRAEGLIPVFPSKTFPNHYTIVTGLYPARHGIVSNNMVDPALPGRFSLSQRDRCQQDTRWWGGEPHLGHSRAAGPDRRRRCSGRGPTSRSPVDRPTYWRMFDNDLSNDERVDQVLAWLKLPDPARPTFLTLYFSDVDSAGARLWPSIRGKPRRQSPRSTA